MVEGGGFEPPKAEPADLQSAPFGRSGTPPKNEAAYSLEIDQWCQCLTCDNARILNIKMEPAEGVEPPTC